MEDPKKEMLRKIHKLAGKGSEPPVPIPMAKPSRGGTLKNMAKDLCRVTIKKMNELHVDEFRYTGAQLRKVVGTAINSGDFRKYCTMFGIVIRKEFKMDIYVFSKRMPVGRNDETT